METTAEFRLFCLALHRSPREQDRAALVTAIADVPRWDLVLEGARRHAVAPLLLAGLQRSGARVPEVVVAGLQREAVAAARRSLIQAAAVAQLKRRFARAGVRVVVLKGVTLSQQLYGDPGLRSARDIDLLVDLTDADAAEQLLMESGHRRSSAAPSADQRSLFRRWFKEVEYTHPVHGRVELHHRLSDLAELLPWDFAELWRERGHVGICGETIPVLGRRHLACYLCAHGAEHGWERLRWLTDLAVLLDKPAEVEEGLAVADAAGLAAPMLQAIALAHNWLGLAVPEETLARARADRRVGRLDRLLAHSYAGEAWRLTPTRGSAAALLRHSFWQRLYRMSIKPLWRYRLQLICRELRSPADWAAWPLPDRLFWLYPVIRPFGWLLRRGSG